MRQLPLRVLQYGMSASEDAGGVETYLINQFRAMPQTIAQYDFISRNGCHLMAFEEEISAAGAKIYKVTSRHENARRHYMELLLLFWRIRGRYDVLVVNASTLTYGSLILLAWIVRIPIRVYHSHACSDNHQQTIAYRLKCCLDRWVLKHLATHRFACSDVAGKWMFGSDMKFEVIPNAIVTKKFLFSNKSRAGLRAQLGIKDNFVIGMIGNIDPQKNHRFALSLLSAVRKKINNVKLMIVGGAPNSDGLGLLDQIRQLVKDLGLEENVLLLGRRDDVQDCLAAMDLFLMPSITEGFGIAAVEAQLSGLPCLLSTGVPSDVKITTNVKFLSTENDIASWADCICKMKCKRKCAEATLYKTTKYSIENSIDTMKQIYVSFAEI